MSASLHSSDRIRQGLSFDKLGMIVAALALTGLVFQPFSLFRANRIVAARPEMLWSALPFTEAAMVTVAILCATLAILLKTGLNLRLFASVAVLALLAPIIGESAAYLTPADNGNTRISPGAGYWIMVFAFSISFADSMIRKRLSPSGRVGTLILVSLAFFLLLQSGVWNSLSILKEYANRADAFGRECRIHLLLAAGSIGAATLVGIPLGVLCFRATRLRAPVINSLNVLQTVPSIALFGLLIAPLSWIGRNVPGAGALGIAGIGAAPAFVALFAYALLPVVSNTLAGFDSVPFAARDAARGMGMTRRQQLFKVEIPLAFPIILTGIRIVLVQNIGLAVIAGLIGGGGLGTFVFQGISQTAPDLVLLGALPVVAMAFAAAIILDALVEASRSVKRQGSPA